MTQLALAPRFADAVRMPSAQEFFSQFANALRPRTTSALRDRLVDSTISALIAGFEDAIGEADAEYAAPNQAALKQAQTLIESLPLATVAPTPLFEPSGAIALEWDVGAGRFFVVALDGSGHIDYSAILGPGDEHSGRVPFKGRLPERAATLLAELLPA
jgi:hypothetical protein